MSMTEQVKHFEALQAWLPSDFDKQDLRNAMGLLLTKVKDLEQRLAEGKPFEEFNRIDQELAILRHLANDVSSGLSKLATLETQVKVLTVQNARLQDDMRELRK